MRRRWASWAGDTRGAAALEFAAAGTAIVILLFAIFNIGLLFMAQRGLDYGIAKAVRWAVVNGSTASTATVLGQFQAATSTVLPGSANCQGVDAGAKIPGGANCYVTVGFASGSAVGSMVTVQASYNWTPVASITGFTAITLQSSIALPIQH